MRCAARFVELQLHSSSSYNSTAAKVPQTPRYKLWIMCFDWNRAFVPEPQEATPTERSTNLYHNSTHHRTPALTAKAIQLCSRQPSTHKQTIYVHENVLLHFIVCLRCSALLHPPPFCAGALHSHTCSVCNQRKGDTKTIRIHNADGTEPAPVQYRTKGVLLCTTAASWRSALDHQQNHDTRPTPENHPVAHACEHLRILVVHFEHHVNTLLPCWPLSESTVGVV